MAFMADRIKLPDLINKWMEVQKTRVGLDDENPLKVDAIELTLLLKSMGFKLEYLDFEQEKSSANTLTVDIRCHKSGVIAKLSYDLVDCSCPSKDEKDISFWEVQATGPKVFSKFKNNTSSNLLPEVSENCSLVSKAMLSNLLEYYRTSIKIIERGEDVLQSPLKVATPKISITSPGDTIRSPFATPPAEGRATSNVLSSGSPSDKYTVNVTWSPRKPKSLDNSFEMQTKISATKLERKLNKSVYDIDIDSILQEEVKTETAKNTVNEVTSEVTPVNLEPGDSSFANSDVMKALITSSPNEKEFASIINIDQNHERDLNVIHCIQQARQQIDAALLVMRLNNPCNEIPQGSAVTTTPQTVLRKNPQFENCNEERRLSLPGRSSSLSNISFECSMCGARKSYTEVAELPKSSTLSQLTTAKSSTSSSQNVVTKSSAISQLATTKTTTASQNTNNKTSASSLPTTKLSTLTTNKSATSIAKTSTASKLKSSANSITNKSLSARKDTPRPITLQPKPVAVLRKTSSVTSVTSSARTTSSTISVTKKTSTAIKPAGVVRSRRSMGEITSPMMSSCTPSYNYNDCC